MAGGWYCRPECLRVALTEILGKERSVSRRNAALPHRVPLGLLLLSRQQLTAEQLRRALGAQRNAGAGRIGEWLERLGFATESQITAALARQWSCPVLRLRLEKTLLRYASAIPLALLEAFQMIPGEISQLTGTLPIAFCEAVDYRALYAIEQMLGIRTEACFVAASSLQRALATIRENRKSADVVLAGGESADGCACAVASYAEKIMAEELRVVRCGGHVWARLQTQGSDAVNLVLAVSPARTGFGEAARDGVAV